MIRFVLDTDTCIFWLKGNRGIDRRIHAVGIEVVAISVITACELAYGAWKSQRREENLRVLERLQRTLPTLHTTDPVIQRFGNWKAELEGKGAGLDDADLLIASIASAHECTLVTNNQAHFARLPHLTVENWLVP
ncbi:MAG: type II toxin-antitoxin system VapC family toxin [Candidatus Omnitrophica bacterium]|nr:type II toxin-antitoxin system VapC family toxin [Candidatus Omnitrophota bacterium]